MYTTIQSEGHHLWTVGFTKPDGKWEPESDHDSEREAKQRATLLNGTEERYVYHRSEPRLWTVGEIGGSVFFPHSDHGSESDAADTVIELNA